MSQTVVEIPGLPPGVEVRRSTRRRRSVTAYREAGRTIVVVPQRMARADIPPYVAELVARLEAREARGRRSDAELLTRAGQLSRRYLEGRAAPSSVRWVGNQRRRWGSCTPLDGTIRLSDRLQPMPAYVVDYVLLHELVTTPPATASTSPTTTGTAPTTASTPRPSPTAASTAPHPTTPARRRGTRPVPRSMSATARPRPRPRRAPAARAGSAQATGPTPSSCSERVRL